MIVSTKGRYAVRVMVDIAQNSHGSFVPLKEVTKRQSIPQKYIEGIMVMLSKAHYIEAKQGKGGGYRLSRGLDDYTLFDILMLTEKGFCSVTCLEKDAKPCPKAESCITLPVWKGLDDVIRNYLKSITLASLLENNANNNMSDNPNSIT